jgi:hypothetical protein
LALTGVRPAQTYGHTAVGMPPTSIEACKRNLLVATGLASAGVCGTTAISGKYTNANADPRIVMPIEQLSSWMKLWLRSDEARKSKIEKSWPNNRQQACEKSKAVVSGKRTSGSDHSYLA